MYYLPEPFNPFRTITPSYYLVAENTKKGVSTETPLSYFNCSGQTFSGVKIKDAQHCI